MKAMTSSAVVGILIALTLFFTLNPFKSSNASLSALFSDVTLLIVLCVTVAVVLTTIARRAFIPIPNADENSGRHQE